MRCGAKLPPEVSLGHADFKNAKQRQDLHILFTNTKDKESIWSWPRQIDEMWSCWTQHQPALLYETMQEQHNQLVLVQNAAAGIGPKCRWEAGLISCLPTQSAQIRQCNCHVIWGNCIPAWLLKLKSLGPNKVEFDDDSCAKD